MRVEETINNRSNTMRSNSAHPSNVLARMLILCGAVAGPLFTFAWIVGGANRPSYDPLRHPISSLAIGELGWPQTLSFLLTGFLTLAFAAGLHRGLQLWGAATKGSWAVGAIAIGLLGAGVFVTDPLNGYPVGTPNLPEQYSVPGRLHRLFSALVFFGFPIGCYSFAKLFGKWGERRWAVYSMMSCIAFAVIFILTSAAFAQAASLVNYAGLFQRFTLTIGWTWLTLIAVYVWRVPFTNAGGGRR